MTKLRCLKCFFLFIIAITCVQRIAAMDAQKCSIRNMRGLYGFTFKGENLGLKVGYIFTGLFDADGKGNIVGHGKSTVAGNVTDATFKGTYEINPDCTGSAHLLLPDGKESSQFLVLTASGEGVYILDVGAGVLESGEARRVFRLSNSVDGLHRSK